MQEVGTHRFERAGALQLRFVYGKEDMTEMELWKLIDELDERVEWCRANPHAGWRIDNLMQMRAHVESYLDVNFT